MQFDNAQYILSGLEALTPNERVDWAMETSKQFKRKLAEFWSGGEQQTGAAATAISDQQLERLDHELGKFFNGITDEGSSEGSSPVIPRGVNGQDRRRLASKGRKR